MVEQLERLAVVRKFAGSSRARAETGKLSLRVHPAANGYLVNFREG